LIAGASKAVIPPSNVPLDACDLPFFANVVAEFARADWTAHQLELAAMLARTMADLEREQRLLRDEGSIAYSERGTPVANPRKMIVQMHAGSILSFRRSLALHARAQADTHNIADRRKLAKRIENIGELRDDDLIAKPH
jgi:hypothetical protein